MRPSSSKSGLTQESSTTRKIRRRGRECDNKPISQYRAAHRFSRRRDGIDKLTRRPGETIVLTTGNEEITIHFDLASRQIKVSVDAPLSVDILRGELPDRNTVEQIPR